MGYRLGRKSLENMEGLRPDLHQVVCDAIKITKCDFTILKTGGVRTTAMQAKLYRKGASKLNGRSQKSKHQVQHDGFGWAVDLVPYVGGPRWEWPLVYQIAAAVGYVARKNGVPLRWGGVWDRKMDDYSISFDDPEKAAAVMKREVDRYCVRHPGPDFIDGPHYELIR